MSDTFIFPYGITLREDGETEIFPVAEVTFLATEGRRLSLFLVVDSGATISALPASDADMFGIEVSTGRRMTIGGVGGKHMLGWYHDISVFLNDRNMKLPIVFIDDDRTPRILGRAGLFEHFIVIFDEARHRSGFSGRRTSDAKAIRKVLDNAYE